MPELPEAEVAACQLRAHVVGATVRDCWIGRGDIVREGLSSLEWYRGTKITGVERRGKSVILTFAGVMQVKFLAAELGMTGLLLFQRAQTRHPQHTHCVFQLEGVDEPEIRYWNPRRFGRLSFLDQMGLDEYTSRRFGYDPLSIGRDQFLRVLGSTRARLKALLMHQQVIAGIGNIYANEILFRAGLHPDQPADQVGSVSATRLYEVMREVLHEAISMGGSSVRDYFAPDGTEGRYKEKHLVYGKAGERCSNGCGGSIHRSIGERSSFYCPLCQRLRHDATHRHRRRSAKDHSVTT